MRTAGRYLLEEVIGVGSFATVHRARDERLDATVVVKILAENHSLNPEIRERFIAEGRSLRRVSSPHVVAVHDIGESERQQPYLVLEHADRGTLGDRVAALRREGWTASPADLLVLARQLASALEAVHTARLVHRDLSPANVLISTPADDPEPEATLLRPDERLLVADLGMCKDLAVSSGLTVAGGTSGFRPPEMDEGPAVIDTRADLWSLSSLVAWAAEGADLPPASSAALGLALDRSLATDPAERHQDVGDWLAEVEAALAPEPAAPEVPGASEPHTPRLPFVAVALAALLLGLLGGWLVRGSGDPPAATQTARIEIEGPQEAAVGEEATFTLRHLGVRSWVWVLPNGTHLADRESVSLTPTSPGTARVVVDARDAEGRDLRFEHDLEVRE
ncbi:serine/threonine-protein kinase [Ornithinimicrobium panacihumi]|uniref:serine/threonine-protein kinase n=1 Tax=Ornithinimicrobium panacihumi TaxID=2008449 RepID=UPI003F8C9408